MNTLRHVAALCAAGFVLAAPLMADDWPQFRGPRGDNVSAEQGLLPRWPSDGPKLLGTYRECGIGYAGLAVVGDRLYTIGAREEKELLIALDLSQLADGKVGEAWSVELGPKFDWEGNRWSAGSSATPTVDGSLVFALSGGGDLACVSTTDGQLKWRKNLPSDLEAQVNPIGGGPKNLGWGFTASPLVDGDRLILLPGGPRGTVAALDKNTGDVLWRSMDLTEQAAYTSPVRAELDGVSQFVVLTNAGLRGVSATDGALLWKHDQRLGTEVTNSPIVDGSLVYITVGTANGNTCVKVKKQEDKFQTDVVYTGEKLANHHGTVVLVNGHVYGSSRRGFVCQAIETGDIIWEERKLPTGSVTSAGGRIYSFGEGDGAANLVDISAKVCDIVGRFKIPEQSTRRKPLGKIWTPPVVAGGRLFLRDQELLFCYDVKAGL